MREAVLGAVAVVLLLLAGWLLFDQGKWLHIYERMRASGEQRDSWDLSRSTEAQNKRLRDRVVLLERSAQVDREASEATRRHIAELQEQLLSLREELSFYRGVMASQKREVGMRVQKFFLRGDPAGRVYSYTLVLTRFVNDDSVAKIAVGMVLEGERDGQPVSLTLADLGRQSRAIEYEFQHFQKARGQLELPEGFRPARLRLTLTAVGDKKPLQSRLFEWQSLFEPAGS